ncbi:hypothetical protein SP19_98 [Salmonella phage 19]|nr:hypothetical protein SP19_98 [Salmonella phage 19]
MDERTDTEHVNLMRCLTNKGKSCSVGQMPDKFYLYRR